MSVSTAGKKLAEVDGERSTNVRPTLSSKNVFQQQSGQAPDHDNEKVIDTKDSLTSERAQGDGAADRNDLTITNNLDHNHQNSRTMTRTHHWPKPFTVNTEIDWLQCALFVFALITRTWRLDWPKAVVFDELHYVRYIALYMNETFFVDIHPPFGKMILSIAGYMTGFDGYTPFDGVGADYPDSIPVWQMRFIPALFGSLLIPVVYQIMVEFGTSRWTAGLAGLLVLCENSFLTESRFILIEGILVFFCAFTIMMMLRFLNNSNRPFSTPWWMCLTLLGISSAMTFSIKYIGAMTIGLCYTFILRDQWKLLADKTISDITLVKHVTARVLTLVILPTVVYLVIFFAHLSILKKAGPTDKIMTSAFQASLEGGLASITKGQPLYVAYGSQITLRHTFKTPCWLHSHNHLYPIRYPDGRGSSHQQQVTCYSFKDVFNWWIVKQPERSNISVDEPPLPVKHGDVVQLVHGMTSRVLNSHDVAAPLSPRHQEVTCYIDHNISAPSYNLWTVEIVNRDVEGDEWKTIQSQIRLIHVETKQALKLTGKQLPAWGYHQFEVATDHIVQQDMTVWNVEEHRYTRAPDQKQREKELAESEMIPLEPAKLSFFQKFWELQIKMLTSKIDQQMEHKYSSDPTQWPTMDRNIAYWISPNSNAQIHLLGNIVIWYTFLEFFVFYAIIFISLTLARRRSINVVTEEVWQRWLFMGELLLGGYVLHYVPFLIVESTYFLYHYLPAVLYKILFLAVAAEQAYLSLWCNWCRQLYIGLVLAWLSAVLYSFTQFAAFSYGLQDFDAAELKSMLWKSTWDFIIHR
ncbi:protein O-mannosyl-transferase 1-like [Tubulanus polymorphus]|uniref:protein O-mannosyl-transferase 1-like n=1 Tax=Tubulanus polymorphus TaxID=672921 RepID=UPI003DA576F6